MLVALVVMGLAVIVGCETRPLRVKHSIEFEVWPPPDPTPIPCLTPVPGGI